MKVQLRGISPGRRVGSHAAQGWLTRGRDYAVLTMQWTRVAGFTVRVTTDTGELAVFSIEDVIVSDASLSKYWTIEVSDDRLFMAPRRWHEQEVYEAIVEESFLDGSEIGDTILADIRLLEGEAGLQ